MAHELICRAGDSRPLMRPVHSIAEMPYTITNTLSDHFRIPE